MSSRKADQFTMTLITYYAFQFNVYISIISLVWSHDLETADVLPVVTDGVSNSVGGPATSPQFPLHPVADETGPIVWCEHIPGVGSSVTLDCTTGWFLCWCCHGEY